MGDVLQPVRYRTQYTTAGQRLTSKLLARGGTMTTPFTRWASGAGVHTGDASGLQSCTALLDERQTGPFNWIEIVNDKNVDLSFDITNALPQIVEAPYSITEIGIYATDPDDGELMYAILVPESLNEMALDQMIPYDGGTAAIITVIPRIAVADAEVAYIAPDAGAYAPTDKMLAIRARVEALEASLDALTPAGTTSIPVSAWTDTADGAQCRIPIPTCTAEYVPQIIAMQGSAAAAIDAGMELISEAVDGAVCRIPIPTCTTEYVPQVVAMQSSAESAISAGMELICDAVDGAVIVYVDEVPKEPIEVTISMMRRTMALDINWEGQE